MESHIRPLILIGPTTTGKTELALNIARKVDGEIINGDKFCLYSGFLYSIGLSKEPTSQGIPTHLYRILVPSDDQLGVEEYLDKVKTVIRDVIARRKIPIIEGCSFSFMSALINESADFATVVGLRWRDPRNLEAKIRHRVDLLIQKGLFDEVRKSLGLGRKDTYVMRKGVFIVPAIEFINGEITKEEAKEKMAIGMLSIAYSELRRFMDVPNIHWMNHSNEDFDRNLSSIVGLINSHK